MINSNSINTAEILEWGRDSEINDIKVLPDGGFRTPSGRTVDNFNGQLVSVDPYLTRFVDGKLVDRQPNVRDDKDIPTGYERRVDLIFLCDNQHWRIRLSKGSIRYLKNYFRQLSEQGLNPGDVITQFGTETKSGQFGSYSLVMMTLAGQVSNGDSSPAPVPEEVKSLEG